MMAGMVKIHHQIVEVKPPLLSNELDHNAFEETHKTIANGHNLTFQ
jgi:hypothetical protein